jgi:hypothetical protein
MVDVRVGRMVARKAVEKVGLLVAMLGGENSQSFRHSWCIQDHSRSKSLMKLQWFQKKMYPPRMLLCLLRICNSDLRRIHRMRWRLMLQLYQS